MTTVNDIYNFIDEIAPFSLQESYDNSGLLVGNGSKAVSKVHVALDITREIAADAAQSGVDLIITHHPVIFRALKKIDSETPLGILLANDISVISAHTNFDSAKMNSILCQRLGLVPVEPVSVENGVTMGLVCEIEEELSPEQLAERVKNTLGNKVVRYNNLNGTDKKIKRVAVCSGSGGSLLNDVLSKKADCYITGDVKHDIFIDAHNAGLCVIDAGHFHTENIFCEYMLKKITEKFHDVSVEIAKSNGDVLAYV